MHHASWTETNRRITRTVLGKISETPSLVRAMIGIVPGIGNLANAAFHYSEYHKLALVALAKQLERKGKLLPDAVRHLHAYERALTQEQRAYNCFLKSFEKHV